MTTPRPQREEQDRSAHAAEAVAHVRATLAESSRVKQLLADASAQVIVDVSQQLVACFRAGGKVLLFGNGGSASDAQHIAAEWTGRYVADRPALPAIALTANSSESTAIANDYGFEHGFARLVEAHGRAGDVAIAISTSGNSSNVLAAVRAARERGLTTVGLIGKGGGELAGSVDFDITIPSDETPRIQESHITVGHILCELVESELFPELASS